MRVFKLGEYDPKYPSSFEEIARRLKIRLERVKRSAEREAKRANTAEEAKEKLAAKLRELGINPDEL
jgi:3-oxoacyl-[acyl-carrier-protein] synthase III